MFFNRFKACAVTVLLFLAALPAQAGTFFDLSGTVTTGGTSQVLRAANGQKARVLIANPTTATENLFVNTSSSASTSAAGSIPIAPGGALTLNTAEVVNITAATTGHAFIAKDAGTAEALVNPGAAGSGGSGGLTNTELRASAVPVTGSGTAGTAAAGVVTVQGIASMTPLAVTASAGTNLNTANIESYTSRLLSGAMPTAGGAATSTTAQGVGGRYNATPPTLTDGQEAGAQLNNRGAWKVDGSAVTQPTSLAAIASVSGNITTQNLVPGGTATAGSAVEMTVTGTSTAGVQVTGTYTGALSLQSTVDGSTWVTECSTTCSTAFTRATTGASTNTIVSAVQDIFTASFRAGAVKIRITALGAVTGTATVNLQPAAAAGSTVGISGTAVVVGPGLHDAVISGAPVRTGCHVRTSAYAITLANDDTSDTLCDPNGATITKPYAIHQQDWTTTVNLTDTTSTALKAAGGAGLYNSATWCLFSGIAATVATQIKILDGTTVKAIANMKAGGADIFMTFPSPIHSSANTALNVQLGGTPTGAIDVTCGGYQNP
jgi:hypothetical protein